MHQAFVDFQCAYVTAVEHGISADLDVIGTRRGIGDDTVRLEHPNGVLGLVEHFVQASLEELYGLFGGEVFRFVLEIAATIDVVQIVRKHQAQVGQGRITGMERIGCRAVQLLGDQAKVFSAARFKHAHHHAVFLAHAPHDLPDRVELPQLAGDVTLDVLELEFDCT
ncbi:hypothetical protein D3C78_933470 [compost metagenome]